MARETTFTYSSSFPCSAQDLYTWHSRQGALERLIPPWEKTRVISRQGGIAPGATTVMRMYAGVVPFIWRARHVKEEPGLQFEDVQESGPFSSWTHTHSFYDNSLGCRLEDSIIYALPLHSLLPGFTTQRMERTLRRIFHYRHATLLDDIRLHQRCSSRPLSLLITGASGVLGQALIPLLTTGGHRVWTLVRRTPDQDKQEVYWNPERGEIDASSLPQLDGVIHLAGDNIGSGRWSPGKKKRVVDSRVLGTGLLARTLAAMPMPVRPKVILSASAVGFYGNCLDCCMREEDGAGLDFISDVCSQWERAATPAEDAGIRTVFMRIGVVLSPRGGALQRLLATSSIGFSRGFGSGDQYISWISVDDMISVMLHALTCDGLAGPVNIAAPEPVTNSELMRTLADVIQRPLLPAIPSGLLKTLYGQMASEVLLSGCRVATGKLEASGYQFRHPRLEPALGQLLGRVRTSE